jgi:hypothetical protein
MRSTSLRRRHSLRGVIPVLTIAAICAALGFVSPASATPVAKVNGFAATAFGSQITGVKGIVHSGPTALTSIGCSKTLNQKTSNSTVAIDAGNVGHVGAVQSAIRTYPSYAGVSDTADSSIAGVNLLGGLITASAVHATSTARATGTTLSSSGSSGLVGLKVAGQTVTVGTTANTKINLAGLGSVTVNQQNETKNGDHISRSVIALHIVISSSNVLGLPIGSDIKVGYAAAGLARYVPGLVSGHAFGSEVVALNGTVRSGMTALASNACLGGNSKNTVATLTNVPGLTAGVVTSTANASVAAKGLELRNTNKIANVKLLGGLITVDAVTAVAHIKGTVGAPKYLIDSTGSSLVGLHIAGITVPTNVKPNTVLNVPGVGTVTLYRTTVTGATIGVVMIQIVLNTPLSGLTAGTRIYVGASYGAIIH